MTEASARCKCKEDSSGKHSATGFETALSLHNEQGVKDNDTSDDEEAVPTPKGRTKKMKGIPYQELVAMQEQRRIERRQKHRDRPKTHYKGLTWHVNQSGKGTWHVQVWTGKTVRHRPWHNHAANNLRAVVYCVYRASSKGLEALALLRGCESKPSRGEK